MASTVAVGGNIVVDESLVLYLDASNPDSYPGSGTSWYDLTQYRNHGSLIGGPTFVSSQIGGSISFDSTVVAGTCTNLQAVTCSNSDSLAITSDLTLSAWIKVATYTTQVGLPPGSVGGIFELISKGTQNFYPAPYTWVFRGPATWYDDTFLMVGSDNLNYIYGPNYPPPPTGSWVHVTMTAKYNVTNPNTGNPGIFFTYNLNNSFYGSGYGDKPIVANDPTKPLYIGGREGTVKYPFSGSIAIVQIYNRALSQSEVLQNYNALKSRFGYF